jgi:hypothetical protein
VDRTLPLFLEHRFFFHANNILQLSMYHWMTYIQYIQANSSFYPYRVSDMYIRVITNYRTPNNLTKGKSKFIIIYTDKISQYKREGKSLVRNTVWIETTVCLYVLYICHPVIHRELQNVVCMKKKSMFKKKGEGPVHKYL